MPPGPCAMHLSRIEIEKVRDRKLLYTHPTAIPVRTPGTLITFSIYLFTKVLPVRTNSTRVCTQKTSTVDQKVDLVLDLVLPIAIAALC